MANKQLLIDEYPLLVYPSLAKAIGLNEAIVLQQIHYWLKKNTEAKRNFRDGHYWVYNSYSEWQNQFPWWSERTLKRIFMSLEKSGYLISGRYNSYKLDRTKWYRIDYRKLDLIPPSCQNGTLQSDNVTQPIPETNYTETTNNGNNGDNGSIAKSDTTSTGVVVTSVRHSDPEISSFIDWYFQYYKQVFGQEHPPIRSAQRVRVHDTLKAFCDENCVETDGLQEMADAFFNVENSDHNINHFATDGILVNRFYEVLY